MTQLRKRSAAPLKGNRRIMHSFTLKEISAVDRPAQTGAVACVMKCNSDGYFEKAYVPAQKDVLADLQAQIEKLSQQIEQAEEGTEDMSKVLYSKTDVEDLAKWFVREGKSEGMAMMMAEARLAAQAGTYEKKYLAPSVTVEKHDEDNGDYASFQKAGRDFAKCVAVVKERDGLSDTAALQRARKEFPAEFEAFQSA